jgi:energy-coupling factor transporter ATP-binding protein EcfA2
VSEKNKRSDFRSTPMITGFFVKNLFGLYTYKNALPDTSDERGERLILIYGDNGSGKTTIVKLIYHLLSPTTAKGHRSYLADTQFEVFGLTFSDGKSLVVKKEDKNGFGAYLLQLLVKDEVVSEVRVGARLHDEEFVVKGQDVDETALDDLYDALFETKLGCFYLSDNREFSSDHFLETKAQDGILWDYDEFLMHQAASKRRRAEHHIDEPTRQLRQSVSRAESWIKDQTLEARSANDESVSDIYKDLIQRLGTYGSGPKNVGSNVRFDLIERLTFLAKSTEKLSSLGMSSGVPIDEFEAVIDRADDKNLPLINQILTPYFDSVQARVDGLRDIAKRLGTLVSMMNKFYQNKIVKVDAVHGIKILAHGGEPIPVEVLSSGEKHLLMLMCNILVGTSERSLFLVDEPELSLNVKWQRMLVDSLLDLSSGSPVQFFMATHSIELLAEHKSSTLRLKNLA